MLKSKNTKIDGSNILYLSEIDAKALGIVEGGVQRVFVDGKEVEITFVDEHEVIPMSQDERKIFDEANKLAKKYANVDGSKNELVIKNQKAMNYDEDQIHEKRNVFEGFNKSMKNAWGSVSQMFNRDKEPRQENIDKQSKKLKAYDDGHEEYKTSKPSKTNDNKKKTSRNKFVLRSDIFTEEELEILQGVISRTKGNKPSKANIETKTITTKKVATPKKKMSKVKTISSSKKTKK